MNGDPGIPPGSSEDFNRLHAEEKRAANFEERTEAMANEIVDALVNVIDITIPQLSRGQCNDIAEEAHEALLEGIRKRLDT